LGNDGLAPLRLKLLPSLDIRVCAIDIKPAIHGNKRFFARQERSSIRIEKLELAVADVFLEEPGKLSLIFGKRSTSIIRHHKNPIANIEVQPIVEAAAGIVGGCVTNATIHAVGLSAKCGGLN
jgi:hypothetical protein